MRPQRGLTGRPSAAGIVPGALRASARDGLGGGASRLPPPPSTPGHVIADERVARHRGDDGRPLPAPGTSLHRWHDAVVRRSRVDDGSPLPTPVTPAAARVYRRPEWTGAHRRAGHPLTL